MKKEVINMRSLFTLLVAILMVVGFSSAGFAENAMTGGSSTSQTAATGKKMESMEKTMTYSGKVVSINTTDHTLIVKGKEGEKTFDVSKVTTLGTVKPGNDVQVVYAEKNGKMVASSVSAGVKTSMNEPAYGYDPYPGYEPHFYGYDPYIHHG